MILVALSVAVLVAAPLVAMALGKSPMLASLLDSFVLVAVVGVVALHVLPQSAALAGLPAVAAGVVGVFLPIALHRLDASLTSSAPASAVRNTVVLAVFCAGIFVHGMFDGAALNGAAQTMALAVAVLLHRLPVGLALWTVVREKIGLARLLVVVAANAAGTVVGGVLGHDALAQGASVHALALVQAFVAGSIVHIVAESTPIATAARATPQQAPVVAGVRRVPRAPFTKKILAEMAPLLPPLRVRLAGVLGALTAALVLFGVERLEGGGDHIVAGAVPAWSAFLTLACACAPPALLSFFLVGVLTALYGDGVPGLFGAPPRRQGARRAGSLVVDAGAGMAAGLAHPLCSCSVAPLYEELLAQGAPRARARAFLVAAPELGVPALLLALRLFGLPFTIARVLGAALVAFVAGAVASSTPPRAAAAGAPTELGGERRRPPSSGGVGWRAGLRHGFVDAVDHVGPWILLGLAVAALMEPALDEHALARLPHDVVTAAAGLLALPLYLCAAGSTPIAAMLVHKGAGAGAALALLLVGPAVSLPTLSLLARMHGKRTAAAFAILVLAAAVVAGMILDRLSFLDAAVVVDVHGARASGPLGVLEWASAGAVAALLLSSLLRQGVRGFLVQIMSPQHTHAGGHGHGGHGHGPSCGHDHGPPLAVPRVALSFDPRGPPP